MSTWVAAEGRAKRIGVYRRDNSRNKDVSRVRT